MLHAANMLEAQEWGHLFEVSWDVTSFSDRQLQSE